MKIILTIKQSDIEPHSTVPENVLWEERFAARAVLFDEDRRVALLYATKRDYYKLPGGGVEEGEDMRNALLREILEEVGAEADVVSEIGSVEEWRYFDAQCLRQTSDAFIATVAGEMQEPDFTEKEIAEGFSVVWADTIQQAVSLVEKALDSPYPEIRFMATRDSAILREAMAK